MSVLQPKGQIMRNITNIQQLKPMDDNTEIQKKALKQEVDENLERPRPTKRNERERNRVKHINRTFGILKDHLPIKKAKLLSKADTLRAATDYIKQLKTLLHQHDAMIERAAAMDFVQQSQQAQFGRRMAQYAGYHHRSGEFGRSHHVAPHHMEPQIAGHVENWTMSPPGAQGGLYTSPSTSPVETGIIPEWCLT